MKFVVENSEAVKRAEQLRENALHPSLLFFDNELKEFQVQKAIRMLQGDDIKTEDVFRHNE
jgi:hypothetical protein